jgi:hypothetical protein
MRLIWMMSKVSDVRANQLRLVDHEVHAGRRGGSGIVREAGVCVSSG